MTAALRMLAFGTPADNLDEYMKIGKSTAIASLQAFCRGVVSIFAREYLRSPTEVDTTRLLRVADQSGFPGMLGSLDCMHWQWDKCPTAYHGFFTGEVVNPLSYSKQMLRMICGFVMPFFGMPGSFNNINVLHQSNLFDALSAGRAPPANFVINGTHYDMGYYLANGIDPKWATLFQTISHLIGNKKKLFAKMQEAYRRDVERAFGVLQARFAIVKGPARFWDEAELEYIMTACVILHNMIIEDQRDHDGATDHEELLTSTPIAVSRDITHDFAQFLNNHRMIHSSQLHHALHNDLIEHAWTKNGEED